MRPLLSNPPRTVGAKRDTGRDSTGAFLLQTGRAPRPFSKVTESPQLGKKHGGRSWWPQVGMGSFVAYLVLSHYNRFLFLKTRFLCRNIVEFYF